MPPEFFLTALAILLTPGPAVLYIVATALQQGRLAGFVSGLGLSVGGLVHVALAWVGVSALLLASPSALRALQIAGAAYLIVLGVRALQEARRSEDPATAPPPRSLGRIFRDGVVVNLLNPKSGIFLFAFLPQFVDPARGPAGRQMFLLGLTFVGLGLLTDGTWAFTAGSFSAWMRKRPKANSILRVAGALVLIGLGVAAAFR